MKTIFIQDADEDVLFILTALLEEADYKSSLFQDSSKLFYSMVYSYIPDLILLDFKLSGLDCINALKQLKTNNSEISVIAISTNCEIQNRHNQFGFDDYVLKPFDLDTLYSTVIRNFQVKK